MSMFLVRQSTHTPARIDSTISSFRSLSSGSKKFRFPLKSNEYPSNYPLLKDQYVNNKMNKILEDFHHFDRIVKRGALQRSDLDQNRKVSYRVLENTKDGKKLEEYLDPVYLLWKEVMSQKKRSPAINDSESQVEELVSWSIPSPIAINETLKRSKDIVDIGAGRGYWAWVLSRCGARVVAVDNGENGYDNTWSYGEPFYTIIREDGVEYLKYSSPLDNHALFISRGHELLLKNCLKVWNGVVVCGEWW
eukprot:TRINITY_DN5831_c0_g2_i1.p1 TRINITY_DN5831_c0_g2~~TRINITY_DN5831_c0_g2_i1.p1  ORF type:complete len:249 (+),score=28.84 TRINITY_DN5831_c0_g2_i1:48-794(+)